mmetsp:Transcript_5900/g.12499  ORF Transcript_5900/g.12499 Transcript_5900/m.12499 type:complete len:396 (-) Transcript_5900:1791-2978(-)
MSKSKKTKTRTKASLSKTIRDGIGGDFRTNVSEKEGRGGEVRRSLLKTVLLSVTIVIIAVALCTTRQNTFTDLLAASKTSGLEDQGIDNDGVSTDSSSSVKNSHDILEAGKSSDTVESGKLPETVESEKSPNTAGSEKSPATIKSKNSPNTSKPPPPTLEQGTYEVLFEFEHNPSYFTQGLSYNDGILYEGTGLYGKSLVVRRNSTTNEIISRTDFMDHKYFGEGLHFKDDKLYQLTWKEKLAFIYNATTLEVLDTFKYDTTTGEGWGITHDGNNTFIVSDGSAYLHYWDDVTLKESRQRLPVVINGKRIRQINELEFLPSLNRVLANVWYKDIILSIDPTTGFVDKIWDFSLLWPFQERPRSADCFNGISVSDVEGEIFVTGKQWSKMFRVKLL